MAGQTPRLALPYSTLGDAPNDSASQAQADRIEALHDAAEGFAALGPDRRLSPARLPAHSTNLLTSGTLPVERGGTGRATFAQGFLLQGNGADAVLARSPSAIRNEMGLGTEQRIARTLMSGWAGNVWQRRSGDWVTIDGAVQPIVGNQGEVQRRFLIASVSGSAVTHKFGGCGFINGIGRHAAWLWEDDGPDIRLLMEGVRDRVTRFSMTFISPL